MRKASALFGGGGGGNGRGGWNGRREGVGGAGRDRGGMEEGARRGVRPVVDGRRNELTAMLHTSNDDPVTTAVAPRHRRLARPTFPRAASCLMIRSPTRY